MPQIVSARYDRHDDAMQAVWTLQSAGLLLQNIAVVSLRLQPTSALSRHAPHLDAEPFDAQSWWEGFLEALLSRRLTPEALRAYTAVIRSGSELMLVHGTAELANIARHVLGQSGARDIELRVSADDDWDGHTGALPSADLSPGKQAEKVVPMNQLILRTLALVLTLSAPALALPGAPGGPVIYKANCASCHGVAGKGGIGPALSDSATWSYAVFSRSLLKGLDDHGNAFKSPMPTFGNAGFAGAPHTAPTPAQMKALQAYLKTLK